MKLLKILNTIIRDLKIENVFLNISFILLVNSNNRLYNYILTIS